MVKITHSINLNNNICFDRDNFLCEYTRGKSILHIGCVDSGFIQEKFQNGDLLHLKLGKEVKELYGIDIDCDGIEFLKDKGIKGLECLDISTTNSSLPRCDIVLVGEVLEHLTNPGLFVESVANIAKRNNSTVVITVPNAFDLHVHVQ